MRKKKEAIMARYNSKHEGDKNPTTKVVIVPSTIYNLTAMIGADCSGIRPAMREMREKDARAYYEMLCQQVADLGIEMEAAIAAW